MFAGSALALSMAGCVAPIDGAETVDSVAQAASTYSVGPSKQYKTLADVASLLKPGDTVVVDGNSTYAGGVRLTKAGTATSKIKIVGTSVNGRRPVISGGTNGVEFAGNHYVFENFEVTGSSSRCVYHHADDITIRGVVIHDCPSHGLLGADSGSGSLTLEYSEVYRSGSGDTRHQIYMATDETAYPGSVFRMQYCYVHDGNGGNNVKSRAERNEIYYNWIEGAYYHEVELIGPDGQDETLAREDSDVVGNVLYQGFQTRSHYAVRIGGDGTGQTKGRYRFLGNTIVMGSASTSAAFRLFDGIESVELNDNALYRQGGGPVTVLRDAEAAWTHGPQIAGKANWVTQGSTSIPSALTYTRQAASPGFVDVAGRDVRLTSTSPLRNTGTGVLAVVTAYPFPSPLLEAVRQPPLHQLLPLDGALARVLVGTLDIGAFEYGN